MYIIDKEGYLNVYVATVTTVFVTVSVTIGLGILAVPVELVDCGIWPFLCVSLIPYIMEVTLILLFIEAIQHVQIKKDGWYIQRKKHKKDEGAKSVFYNSEYDISNDKVDDDDERLEKYIGFEEEELTSEGEGEDEEEDDPRLKLTENEEQIDINNNQKKPPEKKTESSSEEESDNNDSFLISKGIDMHTMGHYYFNRPFSLLFDTYFFIAQVAIIVMYGLLGPQSMILAIFNQESTYSSLLTFPYCFLIFFLTILVHQYIETIISVLVFVKVLFFIIPLILGIYIALLVTNDGLESNPLYLTRSYFILCTMIHGLVSFLPFMLSKIKPIKRDIRWFTISTMIGLAFSVIITILWCLVIIMVVPQKGGSISLEDARENGELSTTPYTEFISVYFPDYLWVVRAMNIFVTCSVTVAYITTVASVKHFLDGYLKEMKPLLDKAQRWVDRVPVSDKSKKVRFARYIRRVFKNPLFFISLVINVVFFLFCYMPSQLLVGSYEALLESVGIVGAMSWYAIFIYSMLFLEVLRREKVARSGNALEKAMDQIPCRFFGRKTYVFLVFFTFFYFTLMLVYGVLYTILRLFFSAIGIEIPF